MEENKKEVNNEANIGSDNKNETTNVKVEMRRIIIETDGNNINLVSADVAGRIELVGVLQSLIAYINNPKNQ